ncbi:MAG: cytochrome C oxidase subunit IV family protein [Verrucomicrobiales bacterium]
MADSPEAIKKHIKTYLLVGATLFVFTAITVWIAYIDLGTLTRNITVGLLIASFKASLVALIFMHLNHEKGLIYKFLVFTTIFFLSLMVLTLLALSDPMFSESFR